MVVAVTDSGCDQLSDQLRDQICDQLCDRRRMRRRNLKLVLLFSVVWAGGFLYYFTSSPSNGGVKVRPPT